jgi:hypothetical protein
MPCLGTGQAVVCMPGETHVVKSEGLGERWCFRCRRKVDFLFTVTSEIEMSYYSPWPQVACMPAGHVDGDLFPGRYREWD